MDYSKQFLMQQAEFYNELADEESKLIYRAKVMGLIFGEEEFYKCVSELDKTKDFGFNELMNYRYFDNENYEGIIIFGCGYSGVNLCRQLILLGYKVIGFCDNDSSLHGQTKLDKPIFSPSDLKDKFKDDFVVISPLDNEIKNLILKQLDDLKFNKENICVPCTGYACILNITNQQYFDSQILKPQDNEVLIDAGAFDGQTAVDFINWCSKQGKTPQKIYSIEPVVENIAKIRKIISDNNYNNIEIIEGGLHSHTGVLSFDLMADKSGSGNINESGTEKINVFAIDDLLKNSPLLVPVTFIKMDIEGAELSALMGAEKTIREYSPTLAISVYHKNDDLFTIPNYIKSINSNYKFYLRKYTPHLGEIVLYALKKD